MAKRNLETYVKEHFGMDLYDFIKCKVEVESLYDYEIAHILNVEASRIGPLRKSLGIRRSNGFSRSFEGRYGKGAVDRFKKMIENPNNSLSDVARHFGFSRQYAWQVYKKIYACSYTEAYKRKRFEKKRKRLVARRDFSQSGSPLEVTEIGLLLDRNELSGVQK